MAGHSKWSKVKHQKAVTDVQKGAAFAKLSKLITLAVIEGGGHPDPEHNVKLRLAVDKAKQGNMPKENIQRAIEKAQGLSKDQIKEVHYEAFGPAGAALLIIATTDNSNRTTSEIKSALDRNGGKLGAQGSVSYLFQHCGLIHLDAANNEEVVFAFAERLDALDIDKDDSGFYVCIPFQNTGKVKEQEGTLKLLSQEIVYRPVTTIVINTNDYQALTALMNVLEEREDVQNVYTNAEENL